MDDLKTPEQRIKKAVMDEKTFRVFCQLLGKEMIPQRVVDEWAQFKVYGDRLGTGSMLLPAYAYVFIVQKAGACPHIPVEVEVNGEIEPNPFKPSDEIQRMLDKSVEPKKPYTGKKRGRKPGSGKKPGRPPKIQEPELVEANG